MLKQRLEELANQFGVQVSELTLAVEEIWGRALEIAAALQALLAAVDAHKGPQPILAAAGAFAQGAFGVDPVGQAADATKSLLTKIDTAVQVWADGFPLQPPDAAALAADAASCKRDDLPRTASGQVVAASLVLKAVGEAIAAVKAARQHTDDVAKALPSAAPAEVADATVQLAALFDRMKPQLVALYCDLVTALATLREPTPPNADPLEHEIRNISRLRAITVQIAETLRNVLADAADVIVKQDRDHPAIFYTMILGGVVAALAGQLDPAAFKSLSDAAADIERKLADPLRDLLRLMLASVQATALGAKAALEDLSKIVAAIRAAVPAAAAQADDLAAELKNLQDTLATYANVTIDPPPGSSPKSPLRVMVDDDLVAPFKTAKFKDQLTSLSRAETKTIALAQALRRALYGLPEALRTQLETTVLRSGLVNALADAMHAAQQARDSAYATIAQIPLAGAAVARALLADPDPAYPITCTRNTQGDPVARPQCDRLAQEVALLSNTPQPLDPKGRAALLHYFLSWQSRQSAPLLIAVRARDALAEIARGDIIAALDLGAYRDQHRGRDREAHPHQADVRLRLQCHHRRTKAGMFQPKPGGSFGIKIRGDIDLLQPRGATSPPLPISARSTLP